MRKGQQTRQEILDQALRLASEVGLEALSIGGLAERAQMSKSGLFAHFSSKENLQVAVLEEAERRFGELVIAPALREKRGEPRVRALLERWRVWGRSEFMPGGCIFMASMFELDDRPGPARERLAAAERDWLDTLAQAARVACNERHFRADLDPELFAFELFGLYASYQLHHRLLAAPHADALLERAAERLILDARASAGAATRPLS